MSTAELTNPYWDAVCDQIDPQGSLWRTPAVGGIGLYRTADGGLDLERWGREGLRRHDYVRQYSWTITDPQTVAFVAEHSRGRLVDPMAGTGYWAWILAQLGVDVAAYDLHPPEPGAEDNTWHRNVAAHTTVHRADVLDAVGRHPDRVLLLSWPPYGFAAARVLDAYRGERVIYIGETDGGCCGDDALFEAFERDWVEIAVRVPVQWDGMHDVVNVLDRRQP